MSTIENVRAGAKKVQQVVDTLKQAGGWDPYHRSVELKSATLDYTQPVCELEPFRSKTYN